MRCNSFQKESDGEVLSPWRSERLTFLEISLICDCLGVLLASIQHCRAGPQGHPWERMWQYMRCSHGPGMGTAHEVSSGHHNDPYSQPLSMQMFSKCDLRHNSNQMINTLSAFGIKLTTVFCLHPSKDGEPCEGASEGQPVFLEADFRSSGPQGAPSANAPKATEV